MQCEENVKVIRTGHLLTKYLLKKKINIQTLTHSDSGANPGSQCFGAPAYSSFLSMFVLTRCHVLFTHSMRACECASLHGCWFSVLSQGYYRTKPQRLVRRNIRQKRSRKNGGRLHRWRKYRFHVASEQPALLHRRAVNSCFFLHSADCSCIWSLVKCADDTAPRALQMWGGPLGDVVLWKRLTAQHTSNTWAEAWLSPHLCLWVNSAAVIVVNSFLFLETNISSSLSREETKPPSSETPLCGFSTVPVRPLVALCTTAHAAVGANAGKEANRPPTALSWESAWRHLTLPT